MTWSGQWVADRLGLDLQDEDDCVLRLVELAGLAVRVNPRRAHLLVSTVLGKHVPVDPRICYAAGRLLGAQVDGLPPERGRALAAALAGDPSAASELLHLLEQRESAFSGVVLGYAETATGLGHAVADSLRAPYLHSTRRPVPGIGPAAGFQEEHSHATGHLLLPTDPELLVNAEQIVLVDDELSTGRTALNTVRALLAAGARCRRFVLAALIDVRADRAGFDRAVAELGVTVEVIALARGRLVLPGDVLTRGQALVAAQSGSSATPPDSRPSGTAWSEPPPRALWSPDVAEGGRHGFAPSDRAALEEQAGRCAVELADRLRGERVLVLGFEELMYAPLRIAQALAERNPELQVRFSSTTRSPVLAVDEPGYAIRTSVSFPAQDDPADGPGQRFAYNVAGAGFTDIIAVIDDAAEPPQLPGLTQVVVLPTHRPSPSDTSVRPEPLRGPDSAARPEPLRGPDFGSYPADEVGWLLTDLSGVELEAPIEEREEAIQLGQAHYAESLPIEFVPSAEYQILFARALEESAQAVAEAVATVTELVLSERGPGAVLASLARAGTPIGALMRRWARYAHGLDLPHYTLSIVRGRGIDELALRYLADRHEPSDVVFVDGWTGKGAIAIELAEAVKQAQRIGAFSTELAVLADPGACVRTFGTRDDFLIPSACLNSTVSGLVSRTVLNDRLIGPAQYHGAKFYRELSGQDVSVAFLDAIAARFPDVSPRLPGEREPTWRGWRAVERISEQYGIGNVNLVKPGVGETTRVLLRRVPWRILARADALPTLQHVLILAEQRGVPVELMAELPYSCVGLIHPGYTRAGSRPPGRSAAAAPAPRVLLAADLDRTLIYSAAAAAPAGAEQPSEELVPVEFRDGAAVSFLTSGAAKLLAELPVVPVTTRSLEQYGRVQLPGPPPKFAVAGNGGHLLVDGVPDPEWTHAMSQRLQQVAPLDAAMAALGRISRPEWRCRPVDGLFCYAVLDQIEHGRDAQDQLREWAEPSGWLTSWQGRKLYLVPRPLTKSAAVAEVKRRMQANVVYAAGDSLLDIDLLDWADHSIHPGHGELAASGWSAPHMQRLSETGPMAGERIVEWLAAAVTSAAPPRRGILR